jgi:hypothetical protein
MTFVPSAVTFGSYRVLLSQGAHGVRSAQAHSTRRPPANPDPPSPTAQAIAFADTGPINKVFGDSDFTNAAADGDGIGAVTYASGNAAVASVDPSTGKVTIVAAGTAQITAIKAADSAYLSAQGSYTITVAKAPQALAFNETGLLNQDHRAAAFNGRLWAIGGAGPSDVYYNDVWSSTNGARWTQVTAAAVFVPRKHHSSGAFNGRLFIFGGSNGSSWEQPMNEIWSSTDGSAWRVWYQNQITLP